MDSYADAFLKSGFTHSYRLRDAISCSQLLVQLLLSTSRIQLLIFRHSDVNGKVDEAEDQKGHWKHY